MAAVPHTIRSHETPDTAPLPLETGDRLTRGEFIRRYEQMPGVTAQLIEGVVYVSSPVSYRKHGQPTRTLSFWLTYYASKTPGVEGADNSTIELDEDNVPQPDVLLRLTEESGGRSQVNERDLLTGPPELVAEVASSSTSIDLHSKLNSYRRNGVQEYLVWRTRDHAVDWFSLHEGEYVRLSVDPNDQLLKSKVFAGLWLDVDALLAIDLSRLMATLDRGTSTAEHAAFVQRLRGQA